MPVVLPAGKTFLKTSSAALKDGSTIKYSFKSALKLTFRFVPKHGGKALGNIIETEKSLRFLPLVDSLILHEDEREVGTEKPPSQIV